MKQHLNIREHLLQVQHNLHRESVSYTHTKLLEQLQTIDSSPTTWSFNTLLSKEFFMTLGFILLTSCAVYFGITQHTPAATPTAQNNTPHVHLIGYNNQPSSANTKEQQHSVALFGSNDPLRQSNGNTDNQTSNRTNNSATLSINSAGTATGGLHISQRQIEAQRPISLLNTYEPDDATLAKLGYLRYGNDSVVSYRAWSNGNYSKIVYRSSYSETKGSVLQGKDLTPTVKNMCSALFPAYVINKNGNVLLFDPEGVGYSPLWNFGDVYVQKQNESVTLQKIEALKKETEGSVDRISIALKTDPNYISGTTRRVDAEDITTPDAKRIRVIGVQCTEKEYQEASQLLSQPLHDVEERYKDSVVILKLRVGNESYYLPYMPNKQFLALLPRHDALQIRAELGNKEALAELRASYKGCHYLSSCASTSGAIDDTEILGNATESISVKIQLRNERILRIALYDINGQLLSEIDKGNTYAAGEHVVPLRVQSATTGWYLLTITSDKGEKVSQRVVIGK